MVVIKKQPQNWYGNLGETAVFQIDAEGDISKYQWQYASLAAGSNSMEFKDSKEPGYNTDTFYILVDSTRLNLRLYRCVLTDALGNSVISDAAGTYALEMKPPETGEPTEPPSIEDKPSGNNPEEDTPPSNVGTDEDANEIVSLAELKQYLRVDFADEDALLMNLIITSERVCMDILRTDDLQILQRAASGKTAVLYATAYLYEHREEADHRAMVLTLRALLSGSRKEGF